MTTVREAAIANGWDPAEGSPWVGPDGVTYFNKQAFYDTRADSTPCARRGCYAQADRRSHSEQAEDLHGICVAESSGRPRADHWSVLLKATGDEPWRVDVVVHAKAWPERKAAYYLLADYSLPAAAELAAALAKAERLRRRLERDPERQR